MDKSKKVTLSFLIASIVIFVMALAPFHTVFVFVTALLSVIMITLNTINYTSKKDNISLIALLTSIGACITSICFLVYILYL